MKEHPRYRFYCLLSISIILLDQITKWWALQLSDEYVIFPFLSLHPIFNTGLSWGLLSSYHSVVWHVAAPALIIFVIAILYCYTCDRANERKNIIGEIMILSGAISNVIDRIHFHGVVDFIEVHSGTWMFPVFNVADCAVTVGIIVMIVVHWYD